MTLANVKTLIIIMWDDSDHFIVVNLVVVKLHLFDLWFAFVHFENSRAITNPKIMAFWCSEWWYIYTCNCASICYPTQTGQNTTQPWIPVPKHRPLMMYSAMAWYSRNLSGVWHSHGYITISWYMGSRSLRIFRFSEMRCYLDSIGGDLEGRIVVELYANIVPNTPKKFQSIV